MKTKHILVGIFAIGFASLLVFTSCKKKEDTKTEEPTEQTPDAQNGTDNREVQGENDAAVSDINDVVGNSRMAGRGSEMTGAAGVTGDICGLTVDSIDIANGSMTFSYTGVTCNNRTRTGKIKVTLQGSKWKNAGAVLKVDYIGYKITRASDQKSITFDGTQYLTNISGGTWWDLLITKTKSNLISTITGLSSMKLTFEDGKTANYNINRRVTYTYPNNIITVTAEGIGSYSGKTNIENYGSARNGDLFSSEVAVPIVWNVTCGGAVIQGQVNVKNITSSVELNFTYGVNTSGNAMVVGPNQCPYGWKLQWTGANGSTLTKVFGYN